MVLVGGGHAHLRVLESLRTEKWPPVRAILLTPEVEHTYSGMVPGYLQGRYASGELTIDLRTLCEAAGAELLLASAQKVDVKSRTIQTATGSLSFTIASLDIGSSPEGYILPGVAEHALTLRPMSAAAKLRDALDEVAAGAQGSLRIAVVGGGAGGVEVALAMAARLKRRGAIAEVVLIERGAEILSGYPSRARRIIEELLRQRGGRILKRTEVRGVGSGSLELANERRLDIDLLVWISGAAPPPLLHDSDLPLAGDGFFAVDEHLQSSDGSPLWGAGDCIAFGGQNLARAGVYPVRQGPILAHNLRATLEGKAPIRYRPRSTFLSLLNTSDGRALLRWRGLVLHGRTSWILKDRIDRGFIRRYTLQE